MSTRPPRKYVDTSYHAFDHSSRERDPSQEQVYSASHEIWNTVDVTTPEEYWHNMPPTPFMWVALVIPGNGLKVKFLRDLDRYPHFQVDAGMTGTITAFEPKNNYISVQVDQYIGAGCAEWDNQVLWTDDELAHFKEDIAPI